MESGALDLAFATMTTPLPPGAINEPLFEDSLALVMRHDHPWRDREWSVADYAEAVHVTIAIRGDDETEVDAALARAGLARRVVLRTPHFLAALAAVGGSDAVTTISAALARRFSSTFGLAVLDTPLASIPLQLSLVSTAARASDLGLQWLRGLIREAAAEVHAAVSSTPGPATER